jgi:putative ABC transport system ATP-binding protein
MKTITFSNVMPKVFQGTNDLESEIWQAQATFEQGRLYLVEAESGKGKSTFCSYILGYRKDYTGEVLFDGENTQQYSADRWTVMRREHVSHLFQELRLFPELTAMENVQIKNQLTNHTDEKTILSWFERLGIPDKVDQKVGVMSFGQQQRVAMMRALVQPFDVLLADEPISHLDDRNSSIMAEIMMEEAKKQDACVIVTSIGKHMALGYNKVYKL